MLFAVAVTAIAVLAWQADQRAQAARRHALDALARERGWAFSVEDPYRCSNLPFDLFERGDGSGSENVIAGRLADSTVVKAFDHWYYDVVSNGKTTRREYHRFSCVVIESANQFPWLAVRPESGWAPLRDLVGFRDLQLESDEFNRAFAVRTDDARFAVAVLDARLQSWLLQPARSAVWFELRGPLALVIAERLDPPLVGGLIDRAVDIRSRIPAVVTELYPPDAQGSSQ